MQLWRITLGLIVTVLLAAGYLASQVAAMNGTAAEYAQKVDQKPIIWLALAALLVLIAAGFLPDKNSHSGEGNDE